jgi:transposase
MLRAPGMRDSEWQRLGRLQRRLARQRRRSNRREQTKRRVAALHQTVRDRRKNWVEVQTTRLVRDYDLIAVEDLNVQGMVRRAQPKPDPNQPGLFLPNGAGAKTGLNRSIHQQGWSLWLRRLEEKAQASGVTVVHVTPAYSSLECRRCGHTAAENRESQAVFRCTSCGHTQNADIHAAENILARALTGLAHTPGPGARRRTTGAARTSRPRGAARTTRPEAAHA